jgi:hypothetical protein
MLSPTWLTTEARGELFIGGGLNHFGQRFDNLLLRGVQVFEFVNVKVFECF